ncbi:MAG: stage III sporulation protein AF [Clostridiaceae bacterium]|nr:stage III sporulation protein AF [Clostridiaceae bacterium]
MLEFVKNWTVNIVILVLFIVITEMLLPKGKMRKYANLMTGTILVIAIIEPVTGLFGKPFDFSSSQTMAASAIDRKEIEKAGMLFEEEQIKQTVRLYRKRIIEQIEHQAQEVDGVEKAKADVIINEDYNSASFGEIKRIYIEAETDAADHRDAGDRDSREIPAGKSSSDTEDLNLIKTPGIRKIDPVKIGDRRSMPEGTTIDKKLQEKLSERITNVFGVSREHIIITQVAR